MTDRRDCKNFAELTAHYNEPDDYTIEHRPGDRRLLVVAPHGGYIEKGTDQIARAIAGTDLSLHVLRCKRAVANPKLHITSADYDQPDALRLVAECKSAIGIHGLGSKSKVDKTVRMGGLNDRLKSKVALSLGKAGFKTVDALAGYDAKDPANICNRAIERGVQLEMPPALRNALCEDDKLMTRFAQAVRAGMGID